MIKLLKILILFVVSHFIAFESWAIINIKGNAIYVLESQ